MGEIADLDHAKDQRQADRDQRIDQPEHQPFQHQLRQIGGADFHRVQEAVRRVRIYGTPFRLIYGNSFPAKICVACSLFKGEARDASSPVHVHPIDPARPRRAWRGYLWGPPLPDVATIVPVLNVIAIIPANALDLILSRRLDRP
jgi:hypothetical protein